jgi:EAL domain-containing protein (putative c-di-GMP-specific phosphodiesterase class I)
MGIIGTLGLWVLRETCKQVTAWHRAHPGARLHYAVNISPLQMQEHGFVDSVAQVLRETGMPAADLVLEITENVFIDNQKIIERIAALKRLGIRLALDDFGTGFSSLGYLSRLPIDILKLDRRFVAALGDTHERGVMRGIVALARTLQLQTIGEGVETASQAEELRVAGCELAQGYFFAKPMPWRDYEALLGTGVAVPILPLEPAPFCMVA